MLSIHKLASYLLYETECFTLSWISIIVMIVYYGISNDNTEISTTPVVGYRARFEPTWLLRVRFIRSSRAILQEGYNQVCGISMIRLAC